MSVPVETSIGFAYSEDDGVTFKKVGTGPVLSSSLNEPVLVGDPFVRIHDGVFHMWYIFGKTWMSASAHEPPARIYKIGYATSNNGVDWKRAGRQLITDSLGESECQALPTVIKLDNRYHMYFCFREATDFRNNPLRSYKLGYAYSDDMVNWQRENICSGVERSVGEWDSEMMCYPNLFQCEGKIYLLYNGNEFGRYGFGLATLAN